MAQRASHHAEGGELLPLPLPVNTRTTPRSTLAAAIRASTAALRRCIRSRWRCGAGASAGTGCRRRSRGTSERHVQHRCNAHVDERGTQEVGVPVRAGCPPACGARMRHAAAEPMKPYPSRGNKVRPPARNSPHSASDRGARAGMCGVARRRPTTGVSRLEASTHRPPSRSNY